MRNFIIKVFLFLIGLVLLSLPIYCIVPLDKMHFLASFDEKESSIDAIQSKKIVITGGSNALYGINSKLIEQQTGLKVKNLSLHGGLSFEWMCNQLVSKLRPGDIGVVIPEFTHYRIPNRLTNISLRLLSVSPRALKYFKLQDKILLAPKSYFFRVKQNLHATFIKKKKRIPNRVSREKVNSFGDLVGHLNQPDKYIPDDKRISSISGSSQFFKVLKRAIANSKERQATLVITFPSIAESAFDRQAKAPIIDTFRLMDIITLGTPSDFILPDSLFYDTRYHLNREGRHIRTRKLNLLLREYLSANHR